MALTPQQEDEKRRVLAGLAGSGLEGLMGTSGATAAVNQAYLKKGIDNGPQQIDTFGGPGGQTWGAEVGRYRSLGEAALGRAAPTLDETQANEARGLQMGSLGLLRDQASGAAPSSAAILGQRANQAAAQQAAQRTMAVKGGPGARIAASNVAGSLAGMQMLQANAQNANARAAEIAKGQQGFLGASAAARGQDIDAAVKNANLEMEQRFLNEKRRQEMERLAAGVRGVELDAGMRAQNQFTNDKADLAEIERRARASRNEAYMTLGSTVAGMGMGAIGAGVAGAGAAGKAASAAGRAGGYIGRGAGTAAGGALRGGGAMWRP